MILTSIERAAVTEGRASVRPTMSGVGYLEGLTVAERQSIADAHAKVPNIQHTPWSEATKATVRRIERITLRAVLAARPKATGPAPEPEYESPVEWPQWTDADVYEPTWADRIWLTTNGQADIFADPLTALDAAAFAASTMSLPPISGGSPAAVWTGSAFRFWTPEECRVRDHREAFGPNGYDDRAEPND